MVVFLLEKISYGIFAWGQSTDSHGDLARGRFADEVSA